VSPADRGTKGTMGGVLVTCARCGARVELPANFCDMCGGRITQEAAADLRHRSGPPVEPREDYPGQLGATVSERRRPTSRVDPAAARRSLTLAHRILKDIEKTMELIEAPTSDGNIAKRVFNRVTSGRRVRTEMAELRRTLDLARKEASKAAGLDPDSIIETDDGPLKVRALLSLADRVEGTIELLAGKPRDAIHHYQSSIKKLETRDAYLDMAVAYERIGQPGEALCAYERCSAIEPDSEVDVYAADEAERLRTKMIMGGWFVGSWIIVIALVYLAALSLLSLLVSPFAGKVALAGCGGGLGLYLLANFRRPVSSEGRERRSSETSSSVRDARQK
jgi:hypothetical protein